MATLDEVRAKFKLIAAFKFSVSDYKEFAQIAAAERKSGFERGIGYDGKKWRGLKPETIKRKQGMHSTQRVRRNKQGISGVGAARAKASKSPASPLIDQGVLMNPTTRADSNGGYVVLPTSRGAGTAGSSSIAMVHEKGVSEKGIWPRPHWGIYPSARERILRLCNILFWKHIRSAK